MRWLPWITERESGRIWLWPEGSSSAHSLQTRPAEPHLTLALLCPTSGPQGAGSLRKEMPASQKQLLKQKRMQTAFLGTCSHRQMSTTSMTGNKHADTWVNLKVGSVYCVLFKCPLTQWFLDLRFHKTCCWCSVAKSRLTLRPHGLQPTRLPCLTFNWTLRECGILIIALPVSLSRVLLPFLSSLKFLSSRKARLHFFPPDWVGVVYSWLLKYS